MAAQRKPKTKTAADENYSKLDQYAIEIHEFYKSLRKAGFTVDNALWLASTRECYPEWMQKNITINDITQYIEDEEDE
jgi:hypothetical protein